MKVVSVGNIYLDINIFSLKNRENFLSPEKEYLSDHYSTELGGSAVIAPVKMAKLGITTTFIGVVGHDEFGKIVKEKISLSGINPELTVLKDVQTNIGVNASDESNQTFMYAAGSANQLLSPEIVAKSLSELIMESDLLYIGGAFKLPQLFKVFIEFAKKFSDLGKKVFLDHGRVPTSLSINDRDDFLDAILPYVDYYAPSQEDIPYHFDRNNMQELANFLYLKFPKLITHLKMGPDGSRIFSEGTMTAIPPYKQITTNTGDNPIFVGAGDTSNAGFIYGISKGQDIIQSAGLANKIAYMHITGKIISPDTIT